MIKRTHIALLCLALAAPALAADLPSILRNAAGQEAEFVQRFTPRGFKTEQVERGKVLFGAAPQMKWSYTAPERKIFIFDGGKAWLYTPSDRQVVVTTLSPEERKTVPLAFLWDPGATQDFAVTRARRGGNEILTLVPRDRTAEIRQAEITASPSGRLRSIGWTDRQGNRNVFEFSGFRKAKPVAGDFRFVPPAGTTVVEN